MSAAAAIRPPASVVERRRNRRIAELLAAASIEISPRDDPVRERLGELLPSGASVFVDYPGSVTHHDIVAACVRLRRAGLTPVPHVAARRLASFTQARDFFARAAGEAGVTDVLLIGGDPAHVTGPFRDSRDLLASGLVEESGIDRVFFAGYPEGHPHIAGSRLDAALRAKLALARARGLDAALVTQFGFDTRPIVEWIAALREAGICCPIRVGVAGPAAIATLAKFAVRCGVGASLRALGRGHAAFPRILAEAAPDALVAALAAAERRGAEIGGLHFFSFGGARRTAEWLAVRRRAVG
jgi:methylenetetrahydrofolate reductase (NADPH)